MKLFSKLPWLVLAIIILIPLSPAYADAAPGAAPGVGGLTPFQYRSTEVQMTYERVEMELQSIPNPDDPGYPNEEVSVTAWFVLHNTGNADEQLQVIFPIDDLDICNNSISVLGKRDVEPSTYNIKKGSFTVSVNGTPEATMDVMTVHPYAYVDPICAKAQFKWAGFNVTFPVDQDVVIRVQYIMENPGDNIIYFLETGAGWKGPIGHADIVFHLPYIASPENVIPDTTPGYQFLYNEIYWSLDNFKPSRADNINIDFASVKTWQEIQSMELKIKQDPQDIESYINLANDYEGLSWLKNTTVPVLIDTLDRLKADETMQAAIAANPYNAEVEAVYASLLFERTWDRIEFGHDEEALQAVLTHLNRALALDSSDQAANSLLHDLRQIGPLTFTPPATIPPTLTPVPSITPMPSITPIPSITPVPSTTITPSASLPPTYTLAPTITLYPTETLTPSPTPSPTTVIYVSFGSKNKSEGWLALVGLVLLLGAGFVSGWFIRGRKKKSN